MSETVSHPSSSCEFIPWQLRRDDLLYVMLPAGEKGPRSDGESRRDIGKTPLSGRKTQI